MASSEQVEVEMGDRFASVGAVIDDQSVAGFVQMELATDALGGGEELAENGMIFGRNGRVAGMVLFGNQ